MTTYGVTDQGFVPKPLEIIKGELEAEIKAAFGVNFDVSAESPFGQVIGIMAERYAELWDASTDIYSAHSPDGATGIALDNIAALTGLLRAEATYSTVTLTLTGTAATVVPAESKFSVATTAVQFRTPSVATLAAATAWASTTGYVVGAIRTNGGNIYLCITSGTSAGSGGPTTTGTDITDGTVHWRYLGGGAAYVQTAAQAVDSGPKIATAYTLTVIDTPIAGLSNVTNLLDAALGADQETDPTLRVRRESELRAGGSAALEAIRSHLLLVTGVESATVFENATDTTDADGIPPHAIECLLLGGIDADIRAMVFKHKAAGIATYGGVTGTVTDSQGISHTVKFSRPTQINIYAIVNVLADASKWPSDGDAQVKAALVAYGTKSLVTGKNVVSSALKAETFKIAGVLDVTTLPIGTAPTPTLETTIAIALREIAKLDTSRITVNVSFGVP